MRGRLFNICDTDENVGLDGSPCLSHKQSIRILVHGSIPRRVGGRQQQGLAEATWGTAEGLSEQTKFEVAVCAPDAKAFKRFQGGVLIFGFSWLRMLIYLFCTPSSSAKIFAKLLQVRGQSSTVFLKNFLKALQLSYVYHIAKPHEIIFHGVEGIIFHLLAIVPASKVTITLHGLIEPHTRGYFTNLENLLSRVKIRSIVFVSKAIRNDWLVQYPDTTAPTQVIPNAINLDIFDSSGVSNDFPSTDERKVLSLITVATVCDRKGQQRVLDAILDVIKDEAEPSIIYTVVGKGAEAFRVANFGGAGVGCRLKLEAHDYLPPEEIRALLLAQDFMIMPSSSEGFGLVFLESIAMGVPVVLPKTLPICDEEGIILPENSFLLEDCSVDSVKSFLRCADRLNYDRNLVMSSLNRRTWGDVGRDYSVLFGY